MVALQAFPSAYSRADGLDGPIRMISIRGDCVLWLRSELCPSVRAVQWALRDQNWVRQSGRCNGLSEIRIRSIKCAGTWVADIIQLQDLGFSYSITYEALIARGAHLKGQFF